MDPEEIIDLLKDIDGWIRKQTTPDSYRPFNRCPICLTVWFPDGQFSVEKHNQECFVPELKRAIEEARDV